MWAFLKFGNVGEVTGNDNHPALKNQYEETGVGMPDSS